MNLYKDRIEVNPKVMLGKAVVKGTRIPVYLILKLLAQGYDSKQASVLGVYLHGLAGDIAAENLSEESLIARNIIEFLPEAFKKLRN